MHDLKTALKATSAEVLLALAEVWGIETRNLNDAQIREALLPVMLDEERASTIFDMLDEQQRGALTSITTARDKKQPEPLFQAMCGTIRSMGKKQVREKKPHHNPASSAEALYYRGLLFRGFDQEGSANTARPVVYIPDDLAEVLPLKRTQYDDLKDQPFPAVEEAEISASMEPTEEDFFDDDEMSIDTLDDDDLVDAQSADTSIVDDLTTLLAYLRMYGAGIEEDSLIPADADQIMPFLLSADPVRLNFMLGVGAAMEVISVEDGRAHPNRAGLQRWLTADRSKQMEMLSEAWRNSREYQDLYHVPGLYPDPNGVQLDPTLPRHAVANYMLHLVPAEEWWRISDLIDRIKIEELDFMRPGGDFDSWYIRSDSGDYLNGIESWDAVEGALIEFMISGPMHWLGLCDIAEDAARLTAYGRAFLKLMKWPQQKDQPEPITITGDDTLHASRRAARVDRFQVARFSTWLADAEPFTYRIDADGIQRAQAQGISTDQIAGFIKRATNGQQIPPAIARLLETWQGGSAASATIENLRVLRTQSTETMDYIWNEPSLRRYLGARLGTMAVVILPEHEDTLRQALGKEGIQIE